jgi:hypothetical protein
VRKAAGFGVAVAAPRTDLTGSTLIDVIPEGRQAADRTHRKTALLALVRLHPANRGSKCQGRTHLLRDRGVLGVRDTSTEPKRDQVILLHRAKIGGPPRRLIAADFAKSP